MKQIPLLKNQPKAYGGDLLRTRKGRAHGRPLDTRHSMHLVLRSSKAVGDWSFWHAKNKEKIRQIILRFSDKYGVKVYSLANVGNHLHLHIKLSNRFAYNRFIRAVTAAIAMAVTGASRWRPMDQVSCEHERDLKSESGHVKAEPIRTFRFWDCRPFTRVIMGFKALLSLRDYIEINRLEGFGFKRQQAKFFLKWSQLKAAEGET